MVSVMAKLRIIYKGTAKKQLHSVNEEVDITNGTVKWKDFIKVLTHIGAITTDFAIETDEELYNA